MSNNKNTLTEADTHSRRAVVGGGEHSNQEALQLLFQSMQVRGQVSAPRQLGRVQLGRGKGREGEGGGGRGREGEEEGVRVSAYYTCTCTYTLYIVHANVLCTCISMHFDVWGELASHKKCLTHHPSSQGWAS